MKFLRSRYILIGIISGFLLGGGWLAWAAIQSQVGINALIPSTGAWVPLVNIFTDADNQTVTTGIGGILDVQSMGFNFNGITWDRNRGVNGAVGGTFTGVLATQNMLLGIAGSPSQPASLTGLTFASQNVPASGLVLNDSPSVQTATLVSRSTGYVDPCLACTTVPVVTWLFDGTNQTKQRTANASSNTTGAGLLGVGNLMFDGTNWQAFRNANTGTADGTNILAVNNMLRDSTSLAFVRSANAAGLTSDANAGTSIGVSVNWIFNGTTYDRQRSISATNLTAATSTGTTLNVPLSTWSVTNTPAAATQATASKGAGGGTVRHVATTITACSAQAGTAQTPIAINLRDGATGAGTILRTWKISSIIQDSKCVEASGLAMIGTANTAMTIEFAAAGVAASEQTVTLTGFSVP